MDLSLVELKRLHDKAYSHGQITRERASDDLVFYHVTQWDDNLLGEVQLQYRGQFDVLRKAGRHITSELRNNPVQVNFEPVDEERDDGADLLDGLYRKDDRTNTSLEAYNNASLEGVVCGIGGWYLYADYQSSRSGDTKQVIRRKPFYEANNKCFWDPNAKLLDKSDADYVSVLHAYSKDGYQKLYKELTGDDHDGSYSSFKFPEESYTFPWTAEDEKVYVVEFYHTYVAKDKIIVLEDIFGDTITVSEMDLDDNMDDLIDAGYNVVSEKDIKRNRVKKYIASGEKILSEEIIAGEYIPVIPYYGERAFVEDEEHYEGIVRLAKDPQRLRNFQMSYLADIVSRSPRQKPIFFPEQIQGYEDMYSESGADNNYPYYLQNQNDANGNPLPVGPPGVMPEQQIPTALAASIELSREAIHDVADPGLPQDVADPDMSGKAIHAIQNRIDQQSVVYQENMKHAKRRDAQVYASMASEIYSAPREVSITLPDGQRKTAKVMEEIFDAETGESKIINDLTNKEFEVYADIGPSYQSQKEQTREQLVALIQTLPDGDPLKDIMLLQLAKLMDGIDFEDVRRYANKRLVIMGIREPDTPEEEQWLLEAQQEPQQPDAATLLAMAEMSKADAAKMREQREALKDQADIINDRAQTEIDAFEAETGRQKVQVDAQKAGAEINLKRIDAFANRLDKVAALRASATPKFAQISR